jgi:hypothetical protein
MTFEIHRNTVLIRGRYGWETGTVPFSKTILHRPSLYRCDAAGFISMCYKIPLNAKHSYGGMSTVTLLTDGWVNEIPGSELKPGDCIGHCGPNSMDGTGGVILLFEKWLNDDPKLGYAITREQLPDASPGPVQRARPFDFRWHAYRFAHILD